LSHKDKVTFEIIEPEKRPVSAPPTTSKFAM